MLPTHLLFYDSNFNNKDIPIHPVDDSPDHLKSTEEGEDIPISGYRTYSPSEPASSTEKYVIFSYIYCNI